MEIHKDKTRFLVSGGNGHLAKYLKEEINQHTNLVCYTPSKTDMNICDIEQLSYHITTFEPHYFIHCAALTRPMIQHETNIDKSISTNIIGTSLVTIACAKHNIKLIYISTDYVYPGTTGNYTEGSPLLPHNNYSWSKLSGECAVQMYTNALILRIAMCNYPFSHKKGITDDHKNWIYDKDVIPIILQLRDETGIINIGGPSTSSYEFGKLENPDIEETTINEISNIEMCRNSSMSLAKMNGVLLRKKFDDNKQN